MGSTRPIIGITKPDKKDYLAYLAIKFAVILAGGKPQKLTSSFENGYKNAAVDGLVIGGGKDIFPGFYNQSINPEYVYDKDRDEMEIFWAERARDENIPTLAICRGAQLMNIVSGGGLHKSVAAVYEDANYPDGFLHNTFYRKEIIVTEKSLLNRITGKRRLCVNSIHKMAIAELGKNLVINAQENNNVVQAISNNDHPFYLGVQFHPEFLTYRSVFRKIFEALVNKAHEKSQPL